VLCERAASQRFGPATLIVRPTYVIGPNDYSGRFTYWVRRISHGGEVLAPGDPAANVQVIDARDQAAWIVDMLAAKRGGTFHAVSPSATFTFGDMLAGIAAVVAPPGTRLTWVDSDFLRRNGETDESLPLWASDESELVANTADPAAAYAAGLRPRPFAQTVQDIAAADEPPVSALTATREEELLARWRATRG
jgi:2'-hydroxyisoflavone reductase